MNNFQKITSLLVLVGTMSLARAGIIEDLLAAPAVQSLLGRLPELQAVVQRCSDARYKQRNPKICQQAEEASRLARMPPELRVVLSNPTTAASMRELCLAVQASAARNSYLCAELSKADANFATLAEQQRQAAEAAQRQGSEGPQLGR